MAVISLPPRIHPESWLMPEHAEIRDIDITRLWRAHVEPADWRGIERAAYVEAHNAHAAAGKIAAIVAVMEFRKADEIVHRVYNVTSAQELIDQGLSDDHALRLFETGWSGDRVISWVEHPLVLTANPGPLLRAWAHIPQPSTQE